MIPRTAMNLGDCWISSDDEAYSSHERFTVYERPADSERAFLRIMVDGLKPGTVCLDK
jgi:hypothetical protein